MTFSIKTTLLLMTTAGLAIALFLKHADYRGLEKEFATLQASSDVIPVNDESRLYVRKLKVGSWNSWHFQFAVPEDRDYLIRVGEGLPDPDTGRPPVILETKLLVLHSEPGEILQPVIAVEITPSYDRYISSPKPGNDLVRMTVTSEEPNNRQRISIINKIGGVIADCPPEMNWVARRKSGQNQPAGLKPQHPVEELDPDKAQTIFKTSKMLRRVNKSTWSEPRVFEIWIEPK